MPGGMGFMTFMTVVIAKPSEKQIRQDVQQMRKAAKSIASSPESARSFLLKKGYITRDNKLSRKYG